MKIELGLFSVVLYGKRITINTYDLAIQTTCARGASDLRSAGSKYICSPNGVPRTDALNEHASNSFHCKACVRLPAR